MQTEPDGTNDRYKEVIRKSYDEDNYPLHFQKLLGQLCDAFAACTGNVDEDFKLSCLTNGLEVTLRHAEDTATKMAGRVRGEGGRRYHSLIELMMDRLDYINGLIFLNSPENDASDNQIGGQSDDQPGKPDN